MILCEIKSSTKFINYQQKFNNYQISESFCARPFYREKKNLFDDDKFARHYETSRVLSTQ